MTMIVPNLLRYPGPCVVVDPKGELAQLTAATRAKFGPVYILDPFGVTGAPSASHNPLRELRLHSKNIPADAAQLADALIITAKEGRDSHWTDSARNLLTGLILHLLDIDPERATLEMMRRKLNASAAELHRMFEAMVMSLRYGRDGTMANAGGAFMSMIELGDDGKPIGFTQEMRSILSTARQQTGSLDQVTNVTASSSFSLANLGRENMTIYLVLPATRIGTHYRWLRMFIMQAFAAMESNPIHRTKLPAWFVLEEFAALGYVGAIETAAGYLAGFGVKLWVILQDLTQLRRHYGESWETFLGNTGVTIAFGNVDATTTQYLSRLLGETTVQERQRQPTTVGQRDAGSLGEQTSLRTVPLITPDEIALHFSRRTHRALIFVPDERPTYLNRLPLPK